MIGRLKTLNRFLSCSISLSSQYINLRYESPRSKCIFQTYLTKEPLCQGDSLMTSVLNTTLRNTAVSSSWTLHASLLPCFRPRTLSRGPSLSGQPPLFSLCHHSPHRLHCHFDFSWQTEVVTPHSFPISQLWHHHWLSNTHGSTPGSAIVIASKPRLTHLLNFISYQISPSPRHITFFCPLALPLFQMASPVPTYL